MPDRRSDQPADARAAVSRSPPRGRPGIRRGGAESSALVERPPGQGEALLVWALWLAVVVAVVVTYARIDPAQLYHVSRDGLDGGLSRTLVTLNFPISLAAIPLALVAAAALPRAAWWAAGPAIALCAVTAWPGVVDQDDLDARWVNAVPATGVALVLTLTLAATRRAGGSFAPRLRSDAIRIGLAIVGVALSLPWVAADLGFYFPGDVFMGEEPFREGDGTTLAAVHLGQHHGAHGAYLLLTAVLLSRVRLRGGLGAWLTGSTALLAAYGAVNFVQDLWNEQVVKRGWSDAAIPSALEPRAHPIWLVVLALAALSAVVIRLQHHDSAPPPTPDRLA